MNKTFLEIINFLNNNNLTSSSCESFTGGMFANEMTNIPGASKTFIGSFIVYSTQMKIDVLKIKQRFIKKYGVISQECAEAMVYQTQKLLNTHLTIAFTGNAGPTAWENKSSQLGYASILYLGALYSFDIKTQNISREEFKQYAVNLISQKILEILIKK